MSRKGMLVFIVGVFLLCLLLYIIYSQLTFFNYPQISKATNTKNAEVNNANSCPIQKQTKTIRGNSLEPLLKDGQGIVVLMGYYACHPIVSGDIVLIDYVGHQQALIIKSFKAGPGDQFYLEKELAGWKIWVNGLLQKNSIDNPYLLTDEKAREIIAYEKTYGGIIPPKRYLVLGENPAGTLDSTIFGLIGEENIKGRVATMDSKK